MALISKGRSAISHLSRWSLIVQLNLTSISRFRSPDILRKMLFLVKLSRVVLVGIGLTERFHMDALRRIDLAYLILSLHVSLSHSLCLFLRSHLILLEIRVILLLRHALVVLISWRLGIVRRILLVC